MESGFKSGRGGKRAGSGRPSTGRTTKVIRVSSDCPNSDDLMAILDTLKAWKALSDVSSPTSPRWNKLRELLDELPPSIFENS